MDSKVITFPVFEFEANESIIYQIRAIKSGKLTISFESNDGDTNQCDCISMVFFK